MFSLHTNKNVKMVLREIPWQPWRGTVRLLIFMLTQANRLLALLALHLKHKRVWVASIFSSHSRPKKANKSIFQNVKPFLQLVSHHTLHNTASLKQDSTWPPYLKDFLIQDSGAKDSDALCVDDSLVTSAEWPGHLLLTVHNDGDALLLHAESDTMPSVQQGRNWRRSEIKPECSATSCPLKKTAPVYG